MESMTKEELAKMLNGREYGYEITPEIHYMLNGTDLVILYGYSDDNMEFRGAINDEISCFGGGTAYLNSDGLIKNECDEYDCPYYIKEKENAIQITAVCGIDHYCWTYETDIPHATFEIVEGDEKFCRGIVFNLSDVKVKK